MFWGCQCYVYVTGTLISFGIFKIHSDSIVQIYCYSLIEDWTNWTIPNCDMNIGI